MGCCCCKSAVNPEANEATNAAAKARHPLSKQNNPQDLTVLRTPAHIRHHHIRFKNPQGLNIYVQCWLPGPRAPPLGESKGGVGDESKTDGDERKSSESKSDNVANSISNDFTPIGASTSPYHFPVRGAIVALHGLNTHFGYTFADDEYGYPASILPVYNEAGYAVYGVDHQGHGKSDGVKPRQDGKHVGHVNSFDDVAMDVWALITNVVEKRHPGVPVFIHGHCMGGAHCMRALQLLPAAKRPASLAGVILSAPSYMVPPDAKPSKVVLGALGCLSCCCPGMVVADWPDRDDPGTDARFYNDRFCCDAPFSAHYAHHLNTLYGRLESAGTSIDLPLLMTQGAKDTFVRPQDSQQLFNSAVSKNKKLIHITDMEHGLLHEPGCPKLFARVLQWCDAVLVARAGGAALPACEEVTITVGGEASAKFKRSARRVGSLLAWRRSTRKALASRESKKRRDDGGAA